MKRLAAVLLVSGLALAGCGSSQTAADNSACQKALGYADQILMATSKALEANAEFLDAISAGDTQAASRANDKLEQAAGTVDEVSPKYQDAKADCKN